MVITRDGPKVPTMKFTPIQFHQHLFNLFFKVTYLPFTLEPLAINLSTELTHNRLAKQIVLIKSNGQSLDSNQRDSAHHRSGAVAVDQLSHVIKFPPYICNHSMT